MLVRIVRSPLALNVAGEEPERSPGSSGSQAGVVVDAPIISRQLVKQAFRFFQVSGIEAFGAGRFHG
jgi:hypothetical protein